MSKQWILGVILIVTISSVHALTFDIQSGNDIVGEVQKAHVQRGESLYQIARRFDMGLFEVLEANPGLNKHKLKVGQEIIIPSAFILPTDAREGIVLNLAELRIYYFHKDGKKVSTFPVGIGRSGWLTPVGETTVERKTKAPIWRPPKSIRQHMLKKGVELPEKVYPGPKNPLGDFALYLGWQNYLIHGTNQPQTVGIRSSSGCIRMYPEDISRLFYLVDKGDRVNVIHHPYKVGWREHNLFLEAHEPLPEPYYGEETGHELLQYAIDQKLRYPQWMQRWLFQWELADKARQNSFGYPVQLN